MNSIEKLTKIFSHFPGIGPRQAKRFVYFLLSRNNGSLEEFSKNILNLKKEIGECNSCRRFFEKKSAGNSLCKICSDKHRGYESLMIVCRDVDLESVEKGSSYNGLYFVLGGTVPILEKEPEKRIRSQDLLKYAEGLRKKGLKEIIIAVNANPEGEHTAGFVKSILDSNFKNSSVKISTLGKGLSTGAELEYIDTDTFENALKNRS